MSEHPLIYVDMVEEKPLSQDDWYEREGGVTSEGNFFVDDEAIEAAYREYLDRFQPWRWVAKSGDNQEPLAISSEAYFNEADAKHAADLLFGPKSNVYRRQHEVGNVALRLANSVTVPE